MRVVVYYRVSTVRQGRSGLGLEAQQAAVAEFVRGRNAEVLAEYTEVESGKRNERPELARALLRSKVTASTLVIAKLDRLSRNAAFLLQLRDTGVRFVAADLPDACEATVGILAVIAERERKAISERTKAALGAAKARGTRLGNPNGAAALRRAGKGNAAAIEAVRAGADAKAMDLAPVIVELQQQGAITLGAIAHALNAGGFTTPRGGSWHRSSVRNLLQRLT